MSGGYSLEVTDGRITFIAGVRGTCGVGPGHTTRLGLGLTFSCAFTFAGPSDGWMDDEGVGDSFCLRYVVII